MNPIEKRKMELYDLLTQPWMKHSDIRLQHPLRDVKRAEGKNDTLIVPNSAVNAIALFFDDQNIKYHVIKNPALYPNDEISKWMRRYIGLSYLYSEYDTPALLITPFDAEALFEWSKQVILPKSECDPSYVAYLNSQREQAKIYAEASGYDVSNVKFV